MTTSGTYSFNPALSELVLYAFNQIGVRPAELTQEYMQSARMAANLTLAEWANRGVNLWAVDLQQTSLIQGQATYTVDDTTVVVLDAYASLVSGGVTTDRILQPISRSEYAAYPNKDQQGFPTTYWFDRLIAPTITLFPVPDGTSATYLRYYRVRRIQDSELTNAQNVEIPYLFLDAFANALSARLARIWRPEIADKFQVLAEGSYQIAALQNIEQAPFYISPQIGAYYRV